MKPDFGDYFKDFGRIGGKKRAEKLSPKRRKEIAVKASKAAAKKRASKKPAR